MSRARFNGGIFLIEGINSLGTGFYFNYLFFYLKAHYGFSSLDNLLVCALNGFIYVPCAMIAGKYGQSRGYMKALKLGGWIMIAALAASLFAKSAAALIAAMALWTVGMCFTWPNLEALVADKEDPDRLPSTLGIYNVVWSGCNALAYFLGGALAQQLGWPSIFWLPLILHTSQLFIGSSLEPHWKRICEQADAKPLDSLRESHPDGPLFLKMAWVANPFAYIAINSLIPIIPDLAIRLQLSPEYAGFFCSIWFFARMSTFILLALWDGWHYRFRFLVVAYAGLIACFILILVLNHLWMIVLVQIAFGWCVGLIYYSSLYYSMHVGETKGEHGGAHEAAIGAGIFGGPAMGAASLYLFPQWKQSNVPGVASLLAVGFIILLVIGRKRVQRALPAR